MSTLKEKYLADDNWDRTSGIEEWANAQLDAAKTQIGDLQLRIRELEASLIKAKDIPMKYKRMEFNAQLQDENSQLVDQLTAEREALEQERLVSDKLVAALRELSLYVAYNGDDWVKRQATAALAEVSNLRANIARIRKQT